MPRYYFHTADGTCVADEDGTELPSEREARRQALRLMSELLLNAEEEFWETGAMSVCVTDANRLTLFTIDTCTTDAAAAGPVTIFQKPPG